MRGKCLHSASQNKNSVALSAQEQEVIIDVCQSNFWSGDSWHRDPWSFTHILHEEHCQSQCSAEEVGKYPEPVEMMFFVTRTLRPPGWWCNIVTRLIIDVKWGENYYPASWQHPTSGTSRLRLHGVQINKQTDLYNEQYLFLEKSWAVPRCWETLVSLTSSVTARRISRRKKQALVDQSKILSMHNSIRNQQLLSLPVFLSLVPDKMFHIFSASHLSPCLNTQIQCLPPSNSPGVTIPICLHVSIPRYSFSLHLILLVFWSQDCVTLDEETGDMTDCGDEMMIRSLMLILIWTRSSGGLGAGRMETILSHGSSQLDNFHPRN